MSPKNLILEIVSAYQNARKAYYTNSKIRRGRSHPISSIAEDLFAHYLISNDSKIDTIYVDQPIYFKNIEKQVCPDITIVKNGTITSFVDLKMDLGWKRRGLYDLCKKHQEVVKKIKGVECHPLDGETKKRQTLHVSKSVSYNVVIISRTNISSALLDSQLKQVECFSPDLEVFVLCGKKSPNSYDIEPEKLVEKLEVNESEFQRLKKKLR